MPHNLPIDTEKPLNGTMGKYAEQVVICTGKQDWSSKIEDENSGDNLAADIKELVGRGGQFADVCSVLLFNSFRMYSLLHNHCLNLPFMVEKHR